MAQPINTGYQRSAKGSAVTVGGGATLAYASWSAEVKADDLDTTNFSSFIATGGPGNASGESFTEGIHGPLSCDWRCGGDWDFHKNPMDYSANLPPGLFVRDDLASLAFIPSVPDTAVVSSWTFTYARVRTATNGGDVKGKVTFAASGMNQGRFFSPSGSV